MQKRRTAHALMRCPPSCGLCGHLHGGPCSLLPAPVGSVVSHHISCILMHACPGFASPSSTKRHLLFCHLSLIPPPTATMRYNFHEKHHSCVAVRHDTSGRSDATLRSDLGLVGHARARSSTRDPATSIHHPPLFRFTTAVFDGDGRGTFQA